ncbi:MAG: ribulose-phosphate 3-epimerase [Deltaproteobacteria bacterium]|nr:ribulose-phosphate 3-epimerase [Deltaproteobacteria bacterium]
MLDKSRVYIAPSILSADFSCLGEEIRDVERCGADLIHIDVMDGHFVPNITIGPSVIKSIRKISRLPFDVHLMIKEPEKYIDEFVDAGSDIITVHEESTIHLHRALQKIREASKIFPQERTHRVFNNVLCGISLNPHRPLCSIKEIINDIDLLLIMTVNPGFGGQEFIERMFRKVQEAGIQLKRKNTLLEVDGGVNDKNAKKLIKSGVNILVAGSFIFSSKNRRNAINSLRG